MLIKFHMLSYKIDHKFMCYEANFRILPVFFDEKTEENRGDYFDTIEELVDAHIGSDMNETCKVEYEVFPFHKVYEIDLKWPLETLKYLKTNHTRLFDGADMYMEEANNCINNGYSGEYYKHRGINKSGPTNAYINNTYTMNTYVAPEGDFHGFVNSMKDLIDTELNTP